jgi:benzoyl-CoA reductase/2-hydroxyglutaryl-CoA dehydratase subunit BcrC/BadD/HgdB
MTDREEHPQPRFGWICSYTPVEIPWAAGYLPVRLFGGETVPRAQDPRIYHLLCPFVRAVFHRYGSGGEAPPEAVAFVRCCDGMVRLHDVWKEYLPGRVTLLDLPKNATPDAVRYFGEILRGWAGEMSGFAPRPVTTQGLQDAIRVMNDARSLFQEMFRRQKDPSGAVLHQRLHAWVRQWLAEPKPAELERIRAEWESGGEAGGGPGNGPRVLLTSSMLDQSGLVRLLEGAGLRIVAEDECMGARHFDEMVRGEGDPYEALAARYLNKWPCPRMKGHERRLERLEREMEEAGVQGVVAVQLKFCDQSGFDLPILRSHLERKGIPLLTVENDYGEGSLGQLRVRIEAFAEMLQQDWA